MSTESKIVLEQYEYPNEDQLVTSEWTIDDSQNIGTEWVVTLPTKRYNIETFGSKNDDFLLIIVLMGLLWYIYNRKN